MICISMSTRYRRGARAMQVAKSVWKFSRRTNSHWVAWLHRYIWLGG